MDIYNYAWYEDPIVKGLIMDSGTSLFEELIEPGPGPRYSNFSYVAKNVGCASSNAQEELTCMKQVDANTLENFLGGFYNSGSTIPLSFGPAVDEKIVFSDYAKRIQEGKFTKVVSEQNS